MTADERATLRALAELATPGPWAEDGMGHCDKCGGYHIEGPPGVGGTGITVRECADAEYIAAANPAAVLALLDEIDRLRAVADRWAPAQG